MVAKAEYLDKGENPRFIVTSLTATEWAAQDLYEKFYCARGEMENRIKEQMCLFADRLSTDEMKAQLLMIAKIFIAQSQTIDTLRKHLRQAMLDQQRSTAIKKTARQPPQKIDPAICLPQQKRSTVTRYPTGSELGLHTT